MCWIVAFAVVLSGCAATGGGSGSSGGGRYSQSNDGYPEGMPDMSHIVDAVPKDEPRSRSGNRSTYSVWGKTYHVLDTSKGYAATGLASFYGTKFQGYATASGELYDMYTMSAAHKTLPLPTYARVTNLDNGRSVIVKVNDRGPFHDDRLIDLSYAAAYRLDILKQGTGRVRVEAIDPKTWKPRQAPAPTEAIKTVNAPASSAPTASSGQSTGPGRFIQVAALGERSAAERLKSTLEARVGHPVRIIAAPGAYKVQVGPLTDPIMVESTKSTLKRAGYDQAFTVTPSTE
nr:septal ring lytic transglycosylase RlpA family protein [Larsenimonas salina]